jgi:hypothetical protein
MQRVFYYETATGQLRCHDPSCVTAQCGQCNKEENKRKKEDKKLRNQKEAEDLKRRTAEEAIQKTRTDMASGKTFTFTYDRVDERNEEEESEDLIQKMANERDHDRSQIEAAFEHHKLQQENEEEELRQTDLAAAEAEVKKPAAAAAPAAKKQKTSQDKVTTTWNHQTRCMFLKAVAKYNPFGAAVKKDMWAKIADEMHKSTLILKDTQHGDFCVYTDGHGLQVFYERRRDDMDKKVKKESATSGHGGFTRSKDDIEEHNLMQTCINLEKDAIVERDVKRDRKSYLESLKNNEVNSAIIAAAEDDEVVQVRLLKVLQARVRQAKLEQKLFEKDPAKKGMKFVFNAQALRDMEDLERMKPKGESEVLDTTDTEAKVARGGSLAFAIQELSSKMPSMAGFTSVDSAAFATSFFETKHKFAESKALSLQQKLEEIDKQFNLKVINEEERDTYRKKVKDQHFEQLGAGVF